MTYLSLHNNAGSKEGRPLITVFYTEHMSVLVESRLEPMRPAS